MKKADWRQICWSWEASENQRFEQKQDMAMNRVKSFLFGAVEKIVIHCAATSRKDLIWDRMRRDSADCVPVLINPPMLGMEYVQVHYSAGLLRPAHADVMVIG